MKESTILWLTKNMRMPLKFISKFQGRNFFHPGFTYSEFKAPSRLSAQTYCINNILAPQHPTPLIKSIIKEITSALDEICIFLPGL